MRRLNHHHLYLFWIFGRNESFTKTARELSIAQSAVTSQLKQLEEMLELNLIDRTHLRRPEITPEGRKVLEYADSIFESSRELLNWATKGSLPRQQFLKVGALSGLSRNLQYEFVKPLLGRKDIKFEITTGDQDKLTAMLRDHQIDVILSSNNVRGDAKVQFYSHVLTSSRIVFVINNSPKKVKKGSLKDLIKNRGLYLPGNSFELKPELDAFLESEGLAESILGEIDDIALLRILSLRTNSVVALPEMGIKNDIESGEISVLTRLGGIKQRFYAITRQKRTPSPEVKQLIDEMQIRKN